MSKRLVISFILIVLFSASAVFAGFGVHKSIDPNSDSCTGCHRQHVPLTQQGIGVESNISNSMLISEETSEYEFCITCHGPDATGADTDIVYGVYKNVDNSYGTYNSSLNGGGFTKIGGMGGLDITSTHAVDGGQYAAFGNLAGGTIQMQCSSCHDPDGSTNYRLLRDNVNGKNVSNFVTSNETGFNSETILMPKTPKQFDSYVPNYTNPAYKKPTDATKGMSGWCSSCHAQYLSVGKTYIGSDGKRRFHHGINVRIGSNPSSITSTDLPLDKATADTPNNNPENFIDCLTCHTAHGSIARMSNDARVEPTRSSPSSGPGYSALLRKDNRGVCQSCHNK